MVKSEIRAEIFKASLRGLLGILINIIFLGILSFVFPWSVGGWIDGIPFGLFAVIPRLLFGGMIGVIVGVIIGIRYDQIKKGGFIGSIFGGLIGVTLVYKPLLTYILIFVGGLVLSLYFRSKNPGKYTLTFVSFLIFFLINLSFLFDHTKIFSFITADNIQVFYDVLEAVNTTAWIILLIALFRPTVNSSGQTD